MYSELVKKIKENVDFKSGIFQSDDSPNRIINVKWKHNVNFLVDVFNGRLWYYITRNSEQIFYTYTAKKCDNELFQSIQHLVNDIENGRFNSKKTHSEKIMEIINDRQLVSYMNKTKWCEFVHAMDEEMSIAPPFDLKNLSEDDHFELYERFYDRECYNNYDFKSIEWVKVKPKFHESIYRGMLIPDEKIYYDVTEEFIRLMKKYSIPFEYNETDEIYIIYGYKKAVS